MTLQRTPGAVEARSGQLHAIGLLAVALAFLACGLDARPIAVGGAPARLGFGVALAFVVVVRTPRARGGDLGLFAAVLACAFAAERIAGANWAIAGAVAALSLAQVALAAALVRRYASPAFVSVAQVWRFLAIAGPPAAVLSAVGHLVLARATHLQAPLARAAYAGSADLLAFIIVAPFGMGLTVEAIAALALRRRALEAAGLATVLAAVTAAGFLWYRAPVLFFVSPIFLLVTFRFRLPGAAVAAVLMSAIAMPLSRLDIGPLAFAARAGWDVQVLLQTFLAINVLTAAAISSALGERDQLAAIARAGAAEYFEVNRTLEQALLSSELAERMSGIGHWTIAVPSGAQTWSAGVYQLFGVDPARPPLGWDEMFPYLIPEERERVFETVRLAIEARRDFQLEHRIVQAGGATLQVEARARFLSTDEHSGVMLGVTRDLTEERRQAAETAQAEASYLLLAEHATDIVVRIRAGIVLFMSPACQAVTGRAASVYLGKPMLDFIHPDDRRRVNAEVSAVYALGGMPGPGYLEYRLSHADGGWRWISSSPILVNDPVTGEVESITVLRDVTEAKRVSERLEASEARYRLLAETATDMIARFSLGGRITFITQACERILGYTPEELIGTRTMDLTHPDDLAHIVKTYRDYVAKGPGAIPITTSYRARHKDGRWIWLEGMPRAVFDPQTGRPLEMHDTVRDVTARRELEAQLIAAREAAEAGARAKSDFLANMSHELRTPLNSIVGFSGLIAKASELQPETRRRAELVSGASRSLVAIVNDILDVSKFEAEGVTLNPEAVDLEGVLIAAVDLVREEADRKGVHLAVQILHKTEPLQIDPVRLRQVVLNLLGNALKFTPPGGRVTLSLRATPQGALRVAVRDTGVGIAPDRLDAIFARFAQADEAVSRRFGGTGLGLAICRSILDAMGGRIGVESRPGVGSTFWFTFTPESAPVAPRAQPVLAATRDAHAGRRVLLADDNEVNRDLFRALTAQCGLHITDAADGSEAVALVRDQHFDVVLMDVQMPVMDGLAATRAIRAMGRDLPIIALTANVLPAETERCREAGMNDHLGKPYTVDGVLAALTRWTKPAVRAAARSAPVAPLDDLRSAVGEDAFAAFLEGLREQLVSLAEGFEQGRDAADLARSAHKVRGLAGTLGLVELAESYRVFEAACEDGVDLDARLAQARAATREGLDVIAARAA